MWMKTMLSFQLPTTSGPTAGPRCAPQFVHQPVDVSVLLSAHQLSISANPHPRAPLSPRLDQIPISRAPCTLPAYIPSPPCKRKRTDGYAHDRTATSLAYGDSLSMCICRSLETSEGNSHVLYSLPKERTA